MKPKLLSLLTILALVAMLVPVLPAAAQAPDENVVLAPLVLLSGASDGLSSQGRADQNLPIPVTIDDQLKGRPAPQQPTVAEAEAAVAAKYDNVGPMHASAADETLHHHHHQLRPRQPWLAGCRLLEGDRCPPRPAWRLYGWPGTSCADTFETDVITCDQLTTLQASMDQVVATDVNYFGNYVERPAGNANIDVMIYNIVDESYFDPDFPFFIAGFFWSSINETFDRNMIFIDSYDWENRVGPDGTHPYDYEATVAHELRAPDPQRPGLQRGFLGG